MKTFVVHDKDGFAVGLVTSATEGAPPLSAVGHGELMVSEVDMDEGLVRMAGADAEKQAAEVLQTIRIERRLTRK